MRLTVKRVAAIAMSVAMIASMTGCGSSTEETNAAMEKLGQTFEQIESGLDNVQTILDAGVTCLSNNGVDVDAIKSAVESAKQEASAQIDELGAREYFDAVENEIGTIKECYEKVKTASENTKSYGETKTAELFTQLNNNNVDMDFSFLTIENDVPVSLYLFNYQRDSANNLTYAYTSEINFGNIDLSNVLSQDCIIRNTDGAVICNKLLKTKQDTNSSDETLAAFKKHNMAILNAEGLMNIMGSSGKYMSSVLNAAVESESFSMDTFNDASRNVYYTFVYKDNALKYVISDSEGQLGVFLISNLAFGDAADVKDTGLLAKCS